MPAVSDTGKCSERTALTQLRTLPRRCDVPAWLWIAVLWAGFAGTHLLLSSASLRPRLIARLGDQPFRGVYSLAVLAWFVALVWVFARHKHTGPLLWSTLGPPSIATLLNQVVMLLAFAILVAGLLPSQAAPSAMTAPAGHVQAHGLLRITRHPFNAALGLFGIAHLFVNGSLGDVLFFGGFPLFAWIGSRHQDERIARGKPGYDRLVAETSIVPFGAVVSGRQHLIARELPWAGFVAGIVLALVVRHWHGALFGP
jgi:uncharacterized membrane protein